MLCCKCGKNEATVLVYYEVNGVMVQRYVCDQCAAKRCKCCGNTFDDISKSGKCGCPDCYETFYEQLLPRIKKIHGCIEHRGKRLNANSITQVNRNPVLKLRNQLKTLVKQEKYEEAAVVRDKIKQLEAGFNELV